MSSKQAARVIPQADWTYVTSVVAKFTAPSNMHRGQRSAKHATGELPTYHDGITIGEIVNAVVPNGDEDTIWRLAADISLI